MRLYDEGIIFFDRNDGGLSLTRDPTNRANTLYIGKTNDGDAVLIIEALAAAAGLCIEKVNTPPGAEYREYKIVGP